MAYGIVNVPGGAGQDLGPLETAVATLQSTVGASSLALGMNANAGNRNCVALGKNAVANGFGGTALGHGANAGNGGTALGQNVNTGDSAVAAGGYAAATGRCSVALGCSAKATRDNSIAIGYASNVEGNNGIAMGLGALANGLFHSIAIGSNSNSTATEGIAIGRWAKSIGSSGIAIGAQATAEDSSSVAMGDAVKANGFATIAIGYLATAEGWACAAFGERASTSNNSSIQLGSASSLSSITAKVSITVTSDERDKADIEDLDNAMEFLRRVRAFRYKANPRDLYAKEIDPNKSEEEYTEDEKKQVEYQRKYGFVPYDKEAHAAGAKKGSRVRVGVSAQEVQRALVDVYNDIGYANLVNDNLFDLDPDTIPEDVESHLGVSYENFIPFLIQAVQELDRRTSILEGKPA